MPMPLRSWTLLPDAEGEVPDPGIEAHNVHDRLLRSDAPS